MCSSDLCLHFKHRYGIYQGDFFVSMSKLHINGIVFSINDLSTETRINVISRLLCYHAGEDAEDSVTPLNCIG